MTKKIAILGCSGSIGESTLDIVRHYPGDLQVVGLAARKATDKLAAQIREFRPSLVSLHDADAAARLKAAVGDACRVVSGPQGAVQVACETGADIVVSAIVGAGGLLPTVEAIRRKKTIAIANKEVLVMAGPVVTEEARKHGALLLPVDSEHCALHQCLQGRHNGEVRRLILTASGGPFLRRKAADLKNVSVEEALKHPTWSMGPKITVDSATLMNKGLEVIEAKWLFDLGTDKIDVLVHPQSIVHSLAEFVDGTMIAQMCDNDMRIPIQYALFWPSRRPNICRYLDLAQIGTLQFEKPDLAQFPALRLAYAVAREGGTSAAVLNAANEVAVQEFLERRLAFDRIVPLVESVLEEHKTIPRPTLEDILQADRWARDVAIKQHA